MMNAEQVDEFELLQAQLQGLYTETSTLSKKNPNEAVNKFKLRLINAILDDVNALLEEEYRPFADFSLFDNDELPTTSDVVMVISQYLNCMEKMRADNITQEYGIWYWEVNGKQSTIQTVAPHKLTS